MDNLIYLVPLMGLIGLLYTLAKFNWVSKQDPGNDRMKEISTYIAEGAMAFLRAEWKILGYFVVIVAILLAVMASANSNSHWSIAVAFILGAVFSAVAGYIGMRVATKANVRTAQAARTSLSKALSVSFTGGSAMGPKASIANCMAVVAIIPAAAIATPYNPAQRKEPQMPPARTSMGRKVDSIPTASPPITLVAWPVAD